MLIILLRLGDKMTTQQSVTWKKEPIDSQIAGEILLEWLEDCKNKRKNTLIICGTGISMTGFNTAPSGWKVGSGYESFLRSKGIEVPDHIKEDVAQLYQYFCYPDNGTGSKSFSHERHEEFIEVLNSPTNIHQLIGKANFQHSSIVNDVIESDGFLRVYSLNLDDYFETAYSNRGYPPSHFFVNASDLVNIDISDNIFRDWRILAAHGKNKRSSRSVWSSSLLNNELGCPDIPDYLEGEKNILERSKECINQGPFFQRVIFVGLAAPLKYLVGKIKLSKDFEWLWINPYESPKEWLINNEEHKFTEVNGNWVKDGLDKCLLIAHYKFYERWFSIACNKNSNDISLLNHYVTAEHKLNFIQGLFRARRIYDSGISKLIESYKNSEAVSSLNDNVEIFRYPRKIDTHKYEDINLGFSLHILDENGLRLMRLSDNLKHPKLTVATNDNYYFCPVTVHLLKINSFVVEDKFANGIASTFEGVILNPNHRHILVLDVDEAIYIDNLIIAIEQELKHRFPKFYIEIYVRKFSDLEDLLKSIDFNEVPLRPRRP